MNDTQSIQVVQALQAIASELRRIREQLERIASQ
jgi:hypothetical protein